MSKWTDIALGAALAFALLASGCAQTSNTTDQSAGNPNEKSAPMGGLFQTTRTLTVPEGTPLTVALDQSLSSADNHSGDAFTATLLEPVVIEGKTAIPQDAKVTGMVVEANASGRLQGVAKLALSLSSVEIHGRKYDIETTDTVRVGKSHKTRDIEMIGGGAGLGALIGGLAGGGKGAAIGAVAGGGAGTAGAAATGKKDIRLPAETRLSFELRRPLAVTVKG